jgi:MATE family multidrug resistance protein
LDVPPNEPTVAIELRALLALSWPITVAQLLTMTLGLVETAIVGRVSTTELAGVAIGRAMTFAASMVAVGVAMGLEPAKGTERGPGS